MDKKRLLNFKNSYGITGAAHASGCIIEVVPGASEGQGDGWPWVPTWCMNSSFSQKDVLYMYCGLTLPERPMFYKL